MKQKFKTNRSTFLAGMAILWCIIPCINSGASTESSADGSFHFFPYEKINQLEDLRNELEVSLQELPERNFKWIGERFGYHSVFSPEVEDGGSLDEWVEIGLNMESVHIVAVALAPALNPEGDRSKTYGFPRRFKIEFRLEQDADTVHVIDHTHADYENPGIAPAIFDDFEIDARYVRIVVERGEVKGGLEFFALGEVYVFGERENGIANVAPYANRWVSQQFESYPYWEKRFLLDRISPFNAPLGATRKEDTDFIASFPEAAANPKVQVVLDLGRECSIGRVEFYPADPPAEILLPHFGYPASMQIDVYRDQALQHRVKRMQILPDHLLQKYSATTYWRPNTDLFFAVPLSAAKGRYVRLSATSLPKYNRQAIFALGELVVWEGDKNLTADARVEVYSEKIDVSTLNPERLIDGYANGKEIIKTLDWLKGLAERERLERELARVDAELEVLGQAVVKSWTYSVRGLILALVGATILIYARARALRKRAVRAVREQISRDLHDDVGCSLGTIALGINNLREELGKTGFSDDLDELDLVTRETSVALEEAVFFTQKTAISLSDLVVRLQDRAQIILGDEVVNFSVEGTIPDQPVDFMLKRHLFLIFKETMHNCSKHAQATQVNIAVGFKDGRFALCVQDNGQGFDPDLIKRGCGLNNMMKRAEKVGGTLTIATELGSGTKLEFSLPL